MKRTVLAVGLGLSLAAACGPSSRGDNFGNDGGNGSGGGSGSGNGSGGDGCSASAKLIYTVDQGNVLYSFDPTTKSFTSLGTLNCPAGGNYNPFSMGVDRNAVAYVLYVDQDPLTGGVNGTKLFKVDTTSASLTCTQTSFTAPSSLREFGMGFSTTTAGGSVDQLFIAGGSTVTTTSSAKLATLDVNTMATTAVGTVQGSPELTGNANGELWGFFPDANNPRIAQINKTTGVLATATLPASMQGNPMDWAFAFYGGNYYVFLQRDTDQNTIVYEVSPAGALVGQTNAPGKHIVGAGVSTCAPVVIQ